MKFHQVALKVEAAVWALVTEGTDNIFGIFIFSILPIKLLLLLLVDLCGCCFDILVMDPLRMGSKDISKVRLLLLLLRLLLSILFTRFSAFVTILVCLASESILLQIFLV